MNTLGLLIIAGTIYIVAKTESTAGTPQGLAGIRASIASIAALTAASVFANAVVSNAKVAAIVSSKDSEN